MLNSPKIATAAVHIYIIAFLIISRLNVSSQAEMVMIYFAPVVTIWMFYTIISTNPLP